MKLVVDHGWPIASDGEDGNALSAFRNERDYIGQSGKMTTTVAAMNWAEREIMRTGSTLIALLTLARAGNQIEPEELAAICERGLAGLEPQ